MVSTVAEIVSAVEQQKITEQRIRQAQPLVRLWDGEWNIQHILGAEYSAQFSWVSNDTGPGQIELPFTHPAAQWVYDHESRITRGEGRTVGLTVDYCGARWSGILDKNAVEQREDGDIVLVMDFVHDYEHLKWRTITCNPYLIDAVQIPRAWLIAGPITWALRITLWLDLWREHNPVLTWQDDPMDRTLWGAMDLDMSDWPMVVKPESFADALASGVVWGVVTSRYTNFHDLAHYALEDAELTVECRRYLEGDDPPWEGAILRYGTLVIDFVDKSGITVGTSHGGSLTDGLVRTAIEFADDFIDSTLEVITDADTPTDYFNVGERYTDPVKPYVVFHEGDSSPIQSSSWVHSPSKGVQITVGGKSSPGVNEIISATIQGVADVLGGLVQLGSLGGTIDALVSPIYSDTLLAWQTFASSQRSQNNGWDSLFSYFQDGGGKAYSIQALLVLRAGMWATKTVTSWKVAVSDGQPYIVGDKGIGHFFLDDRVGLVLKGDPTGKIHMDRCRKIDLAWGPESPPEWQISIGDDRIWEDPAQKSLGKIERVQAGLHDLGVF